jgi:transcriptional regulator GlxA family with amidase domain
MAHHRGMPASRRVVLVAFDDAQALDVIGPAEVFSMAVRFGRADYAISIVTPGARTVTLSSGLRLEADGDVHEVRGPIDTLVVVGGPGSRAMQRDDAFVARVATLAARARRVTSVCTGALILAQAGLLDGRRATTHWNNCDELADSFPAVIVQRDPIFVRDGNIATSAGVTAGMDLALALVEEDYGAAMALGIARGLVLFVRRPGGQSQFSAQLAAQPAQREPLRELQAWIPDHLDQDLSVAALARRAFMSERNFARAFRRETGMTPAAHVEAARVERARSELETTALGIGTIAARCGFGSVETLRRAFHRRLGIAPADYRNRFRPALGEPEAA